VGLPGELTFVSSRLELPNVGIAVGDINGNGYDDIVVYNSDANPASISAYLGDGTGYFNRIFQKRADHVLI
jgi:hypothetical protein